MNASQPAKQAPPLRTALALARRELRGGLSGFRILLACLALGVAAIASVHSLSGAVVAGLRDDGRAILGGDLALRLIYQGVDESQSAYIEQGSEAVSHFIESRAMARRADEESSVLVELKGVDSIYPLYGTMELRGDLTLPSAIGRDGQQWGAVVDASVLDRLGLKVGERLRLGDIDYSIRAVIKREPDRAGGGGNFGLGPRVLVARESLADTGLMQPGSLLYFQYRLKLPQGTDVAAYREGLEAAFPAAAWRIRDHRNAAPRVAQWIERLTLFLTLVGLTALLVGGVGVSNAVKAFIDGKLLTIATLKCLGAPSRTVFQIYMAQVLVLAGVGILIGVAIGAVVPPLVAVLIEDLLPVPIRAGVYPAALGLAASFGLLTTLAFALWPLSRVHDVPAGTLFRHGIVDAQGRPRPIYVVATVLSVVALAAFAIFTAADARLAAWFVAGALLTVITFRIAAWAVMRVSARMRRPKNPGLRLALSNLHRPGAPTPNVILSLGLGLTVLAAVAQVEGNMNRQMRDSIPERAPAFFFVDIQSHQIDAFGELVGGVTGAGDLQRVPFLRGRILSINGRSAEQALVRDEHGWMIRGDRGLTYSAAAPDNTEIIAGEWWPEDYSGPPLLSVHKDVTEAFDVGVGDEITLNILGREITGRIANVRDLEWRSMQINFAIMLSPEPLARAPHTYIATVSAASEDAESALQRAVVQQFPNVTAVRIKEALDMANRLLASVGAAVRSVAGVAIIAGTLVLAGAIAAGHRGRVYQAVVLKVLGATRSRVLGAFLFEYGLLGVVTAAIAGTVGAVASWAVLTKVMHMDWVFLPSAVVLTTVLCTGITLALGFFGTWRALGQKAAPLLRNE